MAAWFVTVFGLSTSFWVGTQVLSLSGGTTVSCMIASNVIGFCALLAILKLERTPPVKRLMFRSVITWMVFVALFFGPLLLVEPVLRIPRVLAWMALPLILGNGLAVFAFGPVQDWLVARAQRQARLRRVAS